MTRSVVYSGAMARWAADSALRLEQAALELFEQRGYGATTVPQITERAGLTTRTFFRHFADKREVLFLRDREFPDVVRSAFEGLPTDLEPIHLVERGLAAAAGPLEGLRDPIRRRRAIIRHEQQLRERELLKSARLSDAVSDALGSRGVPGASARLLAPLSVLAFDAALDEWLDADADADADRTLVGCLANTWNQLLELAGTAHSLEHRASLVGLVATSHGQSISEAGVASIAGPASEAAAQ